MLKTIEPTAAVYPCPVLIVGTYDAEGRPNAMNVAWGGQCAGKHVALNLSPHATTSSGGPTAPSRRPARPKPVGRRSIS